MHILKLSVLATIGLLAHVGTADASYTYNTQADKTAGRDHICVINGPDNSTSTDTRPMGQQGLTGKVGNLVCQGANTFGQLGQGNVDTGPHATAVTPIGMGSGVTAVAASGSGTCAIKGGQVYCWGANTLGQVGTSTFTATVSTPTLVANTSTFTNANIAQLAAGGDHYCVIKDHATTVTKLGNLYCWGNNSNGQLGDNTVVNKASPVYVVGGMSTPTTPLWVGPVGLGLNSTCAQVSLFFNNTSQPLTCWGAGATAGDNTFTDKHLPTGVVAASDGTTMGGIPTTGQTQGLIVDIVQTASAACAYMTRAGDAEGNHRLYCWGIDGHGEATPFNNGFSGTASSHPVAKFIGVMDQVGAGATAQHMCAQYLPSGGSFAILACWGSAIRGQTGQGNFGTPGGSGGISSISSGEIQDFTNCHGIGCLPRQAIDANLTTIAAGQHMTIYDWTHPTLGHVVEGVGANCHGELGSTYYSGTTACTSSDWDPWFHQAYFY